MTTYMANFVSHIAKVLPDDIIASSMSWAHRKDAPLSKVIYETMKRNQKREQGQPPPPNPHTRVRARGGESGAGDFPSSVRWRVC